MISAAAQCLPLERRHALPHSSGFGYLAFASMVMPRLMDLKGDLVKAFLRNSRQQMTTTIPASSPPRSGPDHLLTFEGLP